MAACLVSMVITVPSNHCVQEKRKKEMGGKEKENCAKKLFLFAFIFVFPKLSQSNHRCQQHFVCLSQIVWGNLDKIQPATTDSQGLPVILFGKDGYFSLYCVGEFHSHQLIVAEVNKLRYPPSTDVTQVVKGSFSVAMGNNKTLCFAPGRDWKH